ncbi:TolC family protein [Plesiomonas shigelloides]|nr:TolC family protein [Plesiomonas shigelloides]
MGLVAITDVQDAQAQYDQVRASQITAQNDLDNSLENLREITGNLPSQINILDTKQFSTDMPLKIDQLMKEADAKNLSLMSARLGQELSREGVRLASSGHLPTLGLQGSVGIVDTDVTRGSSLGNQSNHGDDSSVGITLSIPIYSGGRTSSEVRQAEYGFISSSEALEQAYREIQKTFVQRTTTLWRPSAPLKRTSKPWSLPRAPWMPPKRAMKWVPVPSLTC